MAASMTIDEDLQSRQMAVYGRESMQRLRSAHVLITGINGLGAELAKNIVLANVGSVTLHDMHGATVRDCGSHFYLSMDDAAKGTNRAAACAAQIQELNPGVAVKVLDGPFPVDRLQEWTVVVAVGMPLAEAIEIDQICRTASNPIAFIRTDVRGLCGSVFVDLGPSFTTLDPSGESVKSAIVEHISVSDDGKCLRVGTVDDEPLDFDDGDYCSFAEVKGMEALNAYGALKINEVFRGKKLMVVAVPEELAPSLAGQAFESGGIIKEQRQPLTLAFRSLQEFVNQPGDLWEADESKMAPAATAFEEEFLSVMGSPAANVCYGRSGLLHLGFRALDEYVSSHGALPPPADAAAADELVEIAKRINAASPPEAAVRQLELPARTGVLRQLALGAAAVLPPMSAIFGGIVGQEVIKAAVHKFYPIHQGFYLDSFDCLPEGGVPVDECSAAAIADAGRYGDQVAVFGTSMVEKLQRLNVFLVGSGALGCEFLKGFAMMGVSCADGGQLTVTDDDVIEKSNLSRQFLFRNHNVGQSKSLSAVNAVALMNQDLRAKPLQDRVSPQTEGVFNVPFWQSLDVVVNALDNVKARLYVDERCVFFEKPLLESGTLGTKCNTQMVLPHMTENYGASQDPPEKEAPQCAVHNFPHNIDQCLVLAHSEFVGNFDTTPRDVLEFLAKGKEWVVALERAGESTSAILDKLRGDPRVCCGMAGGCEDVLIAERSSTFEECVGWARRKFDSYFRNRIEQLLHNFPPTATTSQGVPFWSPPKRLPKTIHFDAKDPLHMQFIISAANLRAFMLGVPTPATCRDAAFIGAMLETSAACRPRAFTPTDDVSIETDNKEEDARRRAAAGASPEKDAADVEAAVDKLLNAQVPAGFSPKPNEFEKDDDANFHMDFISSFGNLRARNYSIEEIDKFQAKIKAGRIIPAIATTTAMATGFVLLELYKQLNALPLEARRNAFANLSLPGPRILLTEPAPCAKIKSGQRWDPEMYMDVDEVAYPEGHTLWDKLLVPNAAQMTLAGLLDFFKSTHSLLVTELALVTADGKNASIYSATLPTMAPKNEANLPKRLAELIEEKTGRSIASCALYPLNHIIFTTLDGDDVTAAKVVLQM